jgi:hypothetical protein
MDMKIGSEVVLNVRISNANIEFRKITGKIVGVEKNNYIILLKKNIIQYGPEIEGILNPICWRNNSNMIEVKKISDIDDDWIAIDRDDGELNFSHVNYADEGGSKKRRRTRKRSRRSKRTKRSRRSRRSKR